MEKRAPPGNAICTAPPRPGGQGVGTTAQRRAHQDSREVRRSGVLGSGLMGGEVTKAAALAQFLLQ